MMLHIKLWCVALLYLAMLLVNYGHVEGAKRLDAGKLFDLLFCCFAIRQKTDFVCWYNAGGLSFLSQQF